MTAYCIKCFLFYNLKNRHNLIAKHVTSYVVNKVIIIAILPHVNMTCYQMLCVKPNLPKNRPNIIVRNVISHARVIVIMNDI